MIAYARPAMPRIGVISDTHGLVRPEALRALAGADLIVHAGDVGAPEVLEALRAVAPVVAVRGNNDRGRWARALAETEVVERAGRALYVLHDLHELDLDPRAAGFDAVIAGHSHRPRVERRDGAGVDDQVGARERAERLGAHETVGVGDHTDAWHRRASVGYHVAPCPRERAISGSTASGRCCRRPYSSKSCRSPSAARRR